MNALDTNVWIYSHDRRDPDKQRIAKELIAAARPMALPWQVGCEFIAASRKLVPFGFSESDAWATLADMQLVAEVILIPCPELWSECHALQQRYQLSFWDGLIIAACSRGGVKTLYSENFHDRAAFDGLSVVNPFAAKARPL